MKTFTTISSTFLMGATLSMAQVQGEPESIETSLQDRSDILFYGAFEKDIPGQEDWKNTWGTLWGSPNRAAEIETISSTIIPGGKALRLSYPTGGVGPDETGSQWPVSLEKFTEISPTYDSLYLRYYVKFEDGFDFVKGGKLPGLTGGKDSYSRSGGDQPDGTNGWTMRFMWRTNGEAVVYAYLPDGKYKEGVWGTDISTNKNFSTGKWHCVEQFIKVNTIGQTDGKLTVWLDNEEVINLDDVNYRTVENDNGKVGGFYFSTFHGGNDATWTPSLDSYAQFDGIVIGQERIGPYYENPSAIKSSKLPKPFELKNNELSINPNDQANMSDLKVISSHGKVLNIESNTTQLTSGVYTLQFNLNGTKEEHSIIIK